MNKISTTLLLCFSLFLANAQKQSAKLIIRGDDMGFSHAANEALIKSYKEGVETAIEVIVPSPWFLEAVKMLAQTPSVDVGVHLCLTSEWDNVKWRPMTDCPSLKDANGYFFPKVFPDKSYPGQAILENKYTLQDIEKEFRAQIEAAKKQIPRLSHISGHMGCTNLSEEVKALTLKLAKEYNLVTDNEMAASGVLRMGYDGAHKTAQEKLESFKKASTHLEAGKTYLFVDHPAYDNDEIRAVHHIGYEDVAADRQGVTDLFTDKTLKSFLKEINVEPISYTDWVRTRYFPKMVEKVAKIPPKNNVWVFLLAGQSNMAGRGLVEPQDTMTDKRLLTINKNNEVILAKEPLHFYEPSRTGLDCGVSDRKSVV